MSERIGFESVSSSGSVKDIDDFSNVPGDATHVELQAITNHIAYTMDGATDPTATAGHLLLTTMAPKSFTIEEFRNIRFIQVTGAGTLNVHYVGRSIS